MNKEESELIIQQLKSGKIFEHSSEPDPDPYGGGGYDKSTLSYDIDKNYFVLKLEVWASQYNIEPEVSFFNWNEEQVIKNLFSVQKSRIREVV